MGTHCVSFEEDGSVQFPLYAHGFVTGPTSYMGLRYSPKNHKLGVSPRWSPTVVSSVDGWRFPQVGGIPFSYCVVPIESEWFIYRLETP